MKCKFAGFITLGALTALSLTVAAVSSCATTDTEHHDEAGAVYVSTNESSGNAVLVFNRSADGRLTPGGSFSTGD
jgi:hypothetical protein